MNSAGLGTISPPSPGALRASSNTMSATLSTSARRSVCFFLFLISRRCSMPILTSSSLRGCHRDRGVRARVARSRRAARNARGKSRSSLVVTMINGSWPLRAPTVSGPLSSRISSTEIAASRARRADCSDVGIGLVYLVEQHHGRPLRLSAGVRLRHSRAGRKNPAASARLTGRSLPQHAGSNVATPVGRRPGPSRAPARRSTVAPGPIPTEVARLRARGNYFFKIAPAQNIGDHMRKRRFAPAGWPAHQQRTARHHRDSDG